MQSNIPRILLAAGASGSGKTLITCGLLQALTLRGKKIASFKCGPDYIDPMFHSRVIGTKSRNLDTFFTSRERTRYLLKKNAADCDIAVMEGVMGYYDGVAGTTVQASAYDLADTTDTPVILIVNSRGMSVSLAAYVKGFLTYKENSHIKGVIFNQMSPMLYPRMKKLLEEELGVKALGYVPKVDDCVIESRHLGLVLPEEIPELQERLIKLAHVLEETLDIDGILTLAESAPQLQAASSWENLVEEEPAFAYQTQDRVRIGVADDEAFCFFYADNLQLLEQMGAELVHFSPIHDAHLPQGLDGLLLPGGYPELNGALLEANTSMKEELASAIRGGMPCLAECGGFMYLHEEMEDMDGVFRKTVGVIPGKAFRTKKLTRFGYITLEENVQTKYQADRQCETDKQCDTDSRNNQYDCKSNAYHDKGQEYSGVVSEMTSEDLGIIPAHEFHYFDSDNNGSDFHASKPQSKRGWDCMHRTETMLAGFPHLYYYGNPRVARMFLQKCEQYHKLAMDLFFGMNFVF